MNSQQLRDINQRLVELRKSKQVPSNKREAPTVQYLREHLVSDPPKPLRSHLLTLLANEYGYLGLPDEEEAVRLQTIELDPAEPLPRIALATFLMRLPNRLDDARSATKLAIGYAEATGRFRRHALQTHARIAKARRDYAELTATFQALVVLQVDRAMADSAVENDFLVGLPDGVVDAALLEKVRARQ